MRRAAVISLLAAISYSLIAPLALAVPESNLPACCRRSGAHHCAMAEEASPATGPALQPAPQKCPLFPPATTTPGRVDIGSTKNAGASFTAIVSHLSTQPQAEAHCRVSFSRSHQKRGPPLNPC
jgi:hypothetical protein